MPDATHLKLAFVTIGGGLSHGTATTMAGKLGSGSVRENREDREQTFGTKGTWLNSVQKKKYLQ
ncbi:MAG: hypothetical protein IPG38_09400 [Chitinophagaceae bacterium]|nr:hypothetical protein [Chitinophagaceae bacterium]